MSHDKRLDHITHLWWMLRAADRRLPEVDFLRDGGKCATLRYDDEVTVYREVRPNRYPCGLYTFEGVRWKQHVTIENGMLGNENDFEGDRFQFEKWFIYAKLRGDFDDFLDRG